MAKLLTGEVSLTTRITRVGKVFSQFFLGVMAVDAAFAKLEAEIDPAQPREFRGLTERKRIAGMKCRGKFQEQPRLTVPRSQGQRCQDFLRRCRGSRSLPNL